MHYAPPPYAPHQRPLLQQPSDSIPYGIDLDQLALNGWTTLDIQDTPSDPLFKPFLDLFIASSSFLSMPEDNKTRYSVKGPEDFQVTEEGYSRVEGEKCMIALRKASTTPTEFDLRAKAEVAWEASATVMRDTLSAIERSLGMEEGALVRTTEAQLSLPIVGGKNVATLMRMFQYDRPLPPETEPKVVAEHHKDLGLLTIVVGHSPGLECWDSVRQIWVSTEPKPGLNASILVGQTLAKFTNWRYNAGRHRVFVHPSPSPPPSDPSSIRPLENPAHRYSLVHALRAHFPLHLSHTEFETHITGPFAPHTQFTAASVYKIYKAISNAHWNVNISVEERRKQEELIAEKARKEMEAARAEREMRDEEKRNAKGLEKMDGLMTQPEIQA